MHIEFVGGARTVTGSSYILKDNDFTVMIDCGMFQGKRELKDRNQMHLIYAPEEIDCLLLTHAHIDHSGLIPRLVKNGFTGKIYATTATTDLCRVMLPDSGHIQEMDAEITNRKNKKLSREPIEPLYTADDGMYCMKNFVPVAYGDITRIHPRIEVRFRDGGHILGSSFIEIWVEKNGKKTKIVFSGDIGQKEQAIIRDPDTIEDADILLIESTYGDRLHKNKEETYSEFKKIILDSYNRSGNIVIPAFAVERTQEIIFTLAELFKSGEVPSIPVYIDSPLAVSATKIFQENEECFDDDVKKRFLSGDSPLDFPNLHFVTTTEESRRLNNEARGAIIISASGMCTAGRIKYHLMYNLYKPESSIIFVGYQAEGTLGRRIIDGAKQVKIYGDDVAVRAKIHTLGGFSAHADRDGLLEWMSTIKSKSLKVYVVHGEEQAAIAFSESVRSRFGFQTYVPRWGEIIDLTTMRSEIATYGAADSYAGLDAEMDSLSQSLKTLLDKYARAKEEKNLRDLNRLQDDINDAREMISMITDEL